MGQVQIATHTLLIVPHFFFQLLLQFGADPELRDEDGHSPLEKAQERDDEWHKQCVSILENPGEQVGRTF